MPPQEEDIFAWFVVLLCMSAIVLLFVFAAGTSQAHDAPMGWAYDPQCCSGYDCDVASQVIRLPDGSLSVTNKFGTAVFDSKDSILESGDHHVHACFVKTEGTTIKYCLYLPPNS